MKKIKLLTPLLLASTASITILPLVACNNQPTTKEVTITNESDTSNVTFFEMPEKWTTGQDLTCSYEINESYKTIDNNTSDLKIDNVSIKGCEGVTISETELFIPGKYITGNITINLQVKTQTYKLVNASDYRIEFENLPVDITRGWSINASYTIKDDMVVDTVNSIITVNGVSIKGKDRVYFDNNNLQIPGEYVQGDIVVKLVVRNKKTCYVDTSSCSGVLISGLQDSYKELNEIKATYTLISDTTIVDEENSDILVNGVSIAKETGVKYLNKEINIPKELVTANVTIKIVTKQIKIIDQTWTEIAEACDAYEADQDETAFLTKLTINGKPVTSLNDLIDAQKAITFQFYNNSTQQYINKNELVRIVDYNHDTIAQTNTKAALTFQLVNLLSDPEGNQMRCVYDSSEKNTYFSSDLYNNLSNKEYGRATWYSKDSQKLESYTDSVYYMLKQGTPAIVSAIKTVTKYSYQDYGTFDTPDWKETELPLTFYTPTFREMNLQLEEGEPAVEETNTTFKYWATHSTANDRVMKDENGNSQYYWLSSPYITGHAFAWNVNDKGEKNHADTKTERFGVTFAFSI